MKITRKQYTSQNIKTHLKKTLNIIEDKCKSLELNEHHQKSTNINENLWTSWNITENQKNKNRPHARKCELIQSSCQKESAAEAVAYK